MRAVAAGGHIALIGVLTGVEGLLPTRQFMARQARLQGLIVGNRQHQQDYVRALEQNDLFPVIDKSFALTSLSEDRKSTRLNSSHVAISYAVVCLKNKI